MSTLLIAEEEGEEDEGDMRYACAQVGTNAGKE